MKYSACRSLLIIFIVVIGGVYISYNFAVLYMPSQFRSGIKVSDVSSHVSDALAKINDSPYTSLVPKLSVLEREVPQVIHSMCVYSSMGLGAFLLPQWIDYHIIAGVDQFYIVNQCDQDNDNKLSWLNMYERLGYVTLSQPNCTTAEDIDVQLVNMYSKMKVSCTWSMHLDIDEYIFPSSEQLNGNPAATGRKFRSVASNVDLSFLNTILTNSTNEVYRLPVYSMSTHMQEEHPTSLLIDTYVNGQFSKSDKLLIRSDMLTNHEKSKNLDDPTANDHWIPRLRSSQVHKNALPYSSLFHSQSIDGELVSISAEKSMCLTPTTSFYIKHFNALSFEDYMKISNDKNKSHAVWEKYHYKRRCPLLNEATRKGMSKKMLEQLQKNIQTFCNKTITFEAKTQTWLNGDSVKC